MRFLVLLSLLACKKNTEPAAPAPQPAAKSVEIHKGPLDQREYGYIELDNGIKALLIHDPDTDMAAASLKIHVGHYADPADREGLAHFLEHMLFMGTDEFPAVDAYRTFINNHGGWSNAGTGGESTGYFFQIEQGHLHGAFERFARFFVAPRLDPGSVDDERNAVNSEYSLKIKDHARRIREVRKQTMNQAHPESKFSVGNLDTLADRGDDTVHSALLDFYAAQYRPDRMTVAIIGREPVSVLKQWVIEELSEVPGQHVDRPTRPVPFLPEQLGVRIDMAPLDERRLLEIQFVLPPEEQFWPKQPHSLVQSILGHEGEDTLFARLKQRGWIESLGCWTQDGADDYDLFTLQYHLTKDGASHIDEIVTASLDGVERIETDGLQAFRHQEEARVAELGFNFNEETPVVNAVQQATSALYWVPPEHVLDYWATPSDFDAALIREQTLSHLTPENMRLLVTLPEDESGATLDQLEERYQVKYSMRALTASELVAYRGSAGLELQLPGPNPYLPESIALKPGGASPRIPNKLEEGQLEIWHLQDSTFGVPRASTQVRIFTPAARSQGIKSAVMGALYSRLLNDTLEEFSYPIKQAGLSYTLRMRADGLVLDIFGYDDRQGALVQDLCARIRDLTIDPERFAIEKVGLARDWRNAKSARPITQANWALTETLDPNDYGTDVMLPALDKLTPAQLRSFAGSLFEHASARVLVHGNLTEGDAKSLAATVEGTLLLDSKPVDSLQVARRTIPAGKEVVRTIEIDHNDSTLMVRYQDTATDLDSQARWRLLGQLVNTPFFTQLRTEQQLGYVVGGYYRSADQLPGITMRIQSPVAGPVTLLERVDSFLASYHETLKAMSDDEFANIRDGLSARLRESMTQLPQKSRRLKQDLWLDRLSFDQRTVVADRVDTLNKDELEAMWEQVFLGEQAGRLIVRSFGQAHADEQTGKGCTTEACVAKQLGRWTREVVAPTR